MKSCKTLFATALCLLMAAFTQAQSEKCASHTRWQALAAQHPEMLTRRADQERATQQWLQDPANTARTQALVTIPVVVHVVYNNTTENVSNAQIQSQIDAMNEDFRLLNADSVPIGHPFWPNTADTEIEFCLASVSPTGAATTGITRTSTAHGPFDGNSGDDVKFTSSGGRDNWDPTRYLNIWVCDLGNQLFGYATFPDELATFPDYDGVVINYTAFGTIGTATAPADGGRTAVHEVGHWLNLYHIWGDAVCGDDLVSDTKPAEDANYDCPLFPHNANNSCGAGVNGEMYMNYMDYVNDNCMNMFTFGQKNRMRAALNADRVALLSSNGCGINAAATGSTQVGLIAVAPNPSTGVFTLSLPEARHNGQLTVVDALGRTVHAEQVNSLPHTLDLSKLPNDLYFLQLQYGRERYTEKIVVQH